MMKTTQTLFKWRHFEAQMVLLCVHWYLSSVLSYRDLEEMMAERGLSVDHTTMYRWGCNAMLLNRKSGIDHISKGRLTRSEWMNRS